jgi:oligoribonuclease (3'-5' exoribonuclease)
MNKEKFKNLLFLDVEATGLEEEDRLVQVAYDSGEVMLKYFDTTE